MLQVPSHKWLHVFNSDTQYFCVSCILTVIKMIFFFFYRSWWDKKGDINIKPWIIWYRYWRKHLLLACIYINGGFSLVHYTQVLGVARSYLWFMWLMLLETLEYNMPTIFTDCTIFIFVSSELVHALKGKKKKLMCHHMTIQW